ncbi:unnamed protein product [Boreogadus saida]
MQDFSSSPTLKDPRAGPWNRYMATSTLNPPPCNTLIQPWGQPNGTGEDRATHSLSGVEGQSPTPLIWAPLRNNKEQVENTVLARGLNMDSPARGVQGVSRSGLNPDQSNPSRLLLACCGHLKTTTESSVAVRTSPETERRHQSEQQIGPLRQERETLG